MSSYSLLRMVVQVNQRVLKQKISIMGIEHPRGCVATHPIHPLDQPLILVLTLTLHTLTIVR